jgi:hypothetical protein
MKIKFFLLIFLLYFTFAQCTEEELTVSTDDYVRIGAVCNDGTTTTATGSGACSHHGGVDHLVCE